MASSKFVESEKSKEFKEKREATRFCFLPCIKTQTGDFLIKSDAPVSTLRGAINRKCPKMGTVVTPTGLRIKRNNSYLLTDQIEEACKEHGLRFEPILLKQEETQAYAFICSVKDRNASLIGDLTALSQLYMKTYSFSSEIGVDHTEPESSQPTYTILNSNSIDTLIDFIIWLKKNYAFSISLDNFKALLKAFNRQSVIEKELQNFITPPPKPSVPLFTPSGLYSLGLWSSSSLSDGLERKTSAKAGDKDNPNPGKGVKRKEHDDAQPHAKKQQSDPEISLAFSEEKEKKHLFTLDRRRI